MTFEELTARGAVPTRAQVPVQTPSLTVVQHDEDVPLDRFADWLDGVEIAVVRAWAGEAVPTDPGAVGSGLIVLGGNTNAYADDIAPWLPATRALLAAAVAADVPTLGICLGAQLLAVACGGRIQVAAPPGREAGIARIHWRAEAAGDPVLGELAAAAHSPANSSAHALERTTSAHALERTTPVPSMHADAVVELPPGASWLGSSDMYPYQAFRVGSAWGVQFHPEVGANTLRAWADEYDDIDSAAVAGEYMAHAAEIGAAGRAIAAGFVAVVRKPRQSGTRSSASTIVYA